MDICKCLTDSPRSVPEANNTLSISIFQFFTYRLLFSWELCARVSAASFASFTTLGCGGVPAPRRRALGPLVCELCARCRWCLSCHQPLTSKQRPTSYLGFFFFCKGKTKWFCLDTLLNLQKSYRTRTKQSRAMYFLFQTQQLLTFCPVAPSFLLLLSLSMYINVCVPFCLPINVCVPFCFLNGLLVTKVTPLCWLQWESPKSKRVFVFNPSRVITVRNFNLDAILFLNLASVFHPSSYLSHVVHSHFLSHQEARNVGFSHYHWCEVCHWIKVGFLRFLHSSDNFSALVI